MPKRIQRKRTKGWKMPPNTVSVTRPGKYGNPYKISEAREAGYTGTDAQLANWCCHLFRQAIIKKGTGEYVDTVPSLDDVRALRGKNLACFCPHQPCHADVLLELANSGGEHCTTYGVDKANCDVAAHVGNFLKFKVMGWHQ